MPEKTLVFTAKEAEMVKAKKLTDVYEFTKPLFSEGDTCGCITESDIIPFGYAKILVIHRHNFNQILHFDAVAAGYSSLPEFRSFLLQKTNTNVTDETKVWHIIFELVEM